ncbi:hypothetical protein SDC9_210281 [bioreactor metagenome]|uniref:Uncharacterized protein n=1 Tax=bioreactor metagenome TaxID=1076179 RepID=A0A645JH37_9ZZZZ
MRDRGFGRAVFPWQHERRRGRKNHPRHRVCRKEQAPSDSLLRQRRGENAGGDSIIDADGENQRRSGPV